MICGLKNKPDECKIDVGDFITVAFACGCFFGLFMGSLL